MVKELEKRQLTVKEIRQRREAALKHGAYAKHPTPLGNYRVRRCVAYVFRVGEHLTEEDRGTVNLLCETIIRKKDLDKALDEKRQDKALTFAQKMEGMRHLGWMTNTIAKLWQQLKMTPATREAQEEGSGVEEVLSEASQGEQVTEDYLAGSEFQEEG